MKTSTYNFSVDYTPDGVLGIIASFHSEDVSQDRLRDMYRYILAHLVIGVIEEQQSTLVAQFNAVIQTEATLRDFLQQTVPTPQGVTLH